MIGKDTAQQAFILRDLLPVLAASGGTCVSAGQEGGPAWRADRALAIGMREGDSIANEAVRMRRLDFVVAQGVHRVIALLIRADPENVRLLGHATGNRISAWESGSCGFHAPRRHGHTRNNIVAPDRAPADEGNAANHFREVR